MSPAEARVVAQERMGAAAPRLRTLDGLRGLAALFVLISHVAPSICHLTVLRNWFAVDLFFMISGCVLSRTYEPRFSAGLSPARFMLLRYLRLYPLYAVGLLLGMVAEAISAIEHQSLFSGWARFTAIATGLLILPSPTAHFTPEIIPLNPVGWSLFFELVINFIYAVFWRRLGTRALLVVVILSAVNLVWLAAHNLSFGGTGWPSFWGGFPRVSFSFFVGVLISRIKRAPARRSNWAWAPILAFVVLLFLPWEDAHVRDTIIMMLTLPPLVWCALSFEPRSAPLFAWVGAISYPIYVIHFPLYRIFGEALARFGASPEAFAPWSGIAFVATVIVIAGLLDRSLDASLRRAITNSFSRRLPSTLGNSAQPFESRAAF